MKLLKKIQTAPLFAAVFAYTLLPSIAQATQSVTVTPLSFDELTMDSQPGNAKIIPVREHDKAGIFTTNGVSSLKELALKWGISEKELLTYASVVYGNSVSSLGYHIRQNGPDLSGLEIKIGWKGNQNRGYRPVSYPEVIVVEEPAAPVLLFSGSHMDASSFLGLQKRAQYLASLNDGSTQKEEVGVDHSFDTSISANSDERILGLELRGDIMAAYHLLTDIFSDTKSFKATDGELSLNMFALTYNENLRNAQRSKGLYRVSNGTQLFISPLLSTDNAIFPGYTNLIQQWSEHGYNMQYALNAVEAAGGAIAWEYVLAIGGGAAATAAVATTSSSSSSDSSNDSSTTSSSDSSNDSTSDSKSSGSSDRNDDDRNDDHNDDHDGSDDSSNDSHDDSNGDSDSGHDDKN